MFSFHICYIDVNTQKRNKNENSVSMPEKCITTFAISDASVTTVARLAPVSSDFFLITFFINPLKIKPK